MAALTTAMTPGQAPAAPHALLAGGGTGGHVFPALAVGEELQRRGFRISFAGAPEGLEARLVERRGLPFHPLPARPLLGRGPVDRLRALATLAASTWSARRLLRRQGIGAVVGTGGYVSAPAVLAARLAGVVSLLVEPNASAGLANRWLSRWASGAAVAHPETIDEVQCPAWVTGVPVREAFFRVPPLEPPAPGEPVRLLVLGGSQGARQLNHLMPAALAVLAAHPPADLPPLEVVHQAGERQLEDAREQYAAVELGRAEVELVPFLDDVAGALARAHLVVSRAGAITTAELCAAGRPAILVPLALAGGHQVANARLLADAGAARLLNAEKLEAGQLAGVVADAVGDPQRLAAWGRSARKLGRPGAAAAIADRLEDLLAADGGRAEDRGGTQRGGEGRR